MHESRAYVNRRRWAAGLAEGHAYESRISDPDAIVRQVSGGERRVSPVKKFWPVVLVVFFILLVSNHPAGAFNDEATLYLAQATQATGDQQSDAAKEDADADDENDDDDDYDDDDDEYADTGDVKLIPDPWIRRC